MQSIKSVREHNFSLPGMREQAEMETGLKTSTSVVNDQFGEEGAYVDNICNQPKFDRLTKLINDAISMAMTGVSRPSIRGQVLAKLPRASSSKR